jgi:GNAT superfamily N-acetyltransferase
MSSIAIRGISVEQATINDYSECATLLLKQLAEHGSEAVEENLVTVLKDVVSDPTHGFVLFAHENRKMIGVAYVAIILSAEHCGKVGWLEELYVMPEYRSKGIGAALLTKVIERARKLGIVAIDLEVDAAHRRAESLYQRFGFRPLDRSRWVRTLEHDA